MKNLEFEIKYQRLLYVSKHSSKASIAQFLIASIAFSFYYSVEEPLAVIIAWLALITLILILRVHFARSFIEIDRKGESITANELKTRTTQLELVMFSLSILWSASIFITSSIGENNLNFAFQMMTIAFTVGIIGVAVSVLSAIPRVFYLFATPLGITTLFALLTNSNANIETAHTIAFIAGLLLGLVMFISTSRQFSQQFDDSIIKSYTIEQRELELINRLSMASEYRDSETGNHINRMSYSCYLLALEAGFSLQQAELIRIASSMHDIGKLGVSDEVLLKPGKLTKQERIHIEKHAQIGGNILAHSESEMIQLAQLIAENHHEKVDGTGYPKGLKGYQIPTEAKIAAICDVFDALTSERPYKKPWSNEKALSYIIEHSGSHFDTQLVQKFMKIYPEVVAYAKEHSDSNANLNAQVA